MKNTISVKQYHEELKITNTIKIDNSTDFKDFDIKCSKQTTKKDTVVTSIHIQLNKEETTTLKIGNFTLIGREIELLKEFLNQ